MAPRGLALVAAGVVLAMGASACAGSHSQTTTTADIPFVPVDATHGSATDRAIAAAQAQLRHSPDNALALLGLAHAYIQKAREVADPSLYRKAGELLSLVARVNPQDPDVLDAQGDLANSLHQFAAGLAFGQRAVARNPDGEAGYAVVTDASNELGRYDDALTATQHMADLRSDLPALARVSYARELRGDLDGAIAAMAEAVTAGGTAGGENVAYVQTLLGDLLLTSGDLRAATTAYTSALADFPGFAAARAGQAKVLVAEGRPADAAAILDDVVRAVPLGEYAIAEGDDWAAAGYPGKAASAYDLVGGIERL